MKLLIEEYQYNVSDVENVLDGLFTLLDVEQKVSVSYVGYYYNPHEKVHDVVFILPKVLIDKLVTIPKLGYRLESANCLKC